MSDENNIEIPCPRLELEWVKKGDTWKNRECIYSIVIPLGELDIRRENGSGEKVNEVKAEIGRTKVSGGDGSPPIWEDGGVDMPYRDGAHAMFDSEALGGNIPIVTVCGDVFSIK